MLNLGNYTPAAFLPRSVEGNLCFDGLKLVLGGLDFLGKDTGALKEFLGGVDTLLQQVMYVVELLIQRGKLPSQTFRGPALMLKQGSVLRSVKVPFEAVVLKPFPEAVKDALLKENESQLN